jgi:hypothetical protein
MLVSIALFPTLSRMRGWLVLSGTIFYSLAVFTAFAAPDPGVTLGVPVFTNGQIHLPFTGEDGFGYVVERSADLQSWTPVSTNAGSSTVQDVVVSAPADTAFYRTSRKTVPLFVGALATIDLLGNTNSFDSYDSADPNYSTNGLYNRLTRKAGGDVLSFGLSINVAHYIIAGHVRTPPGGVVLFNSKNTSIGDLAWVSALTPGIEPGWATDDLPPSFFKDVVLPNVWSWESAAGTGTGGPGTAPDGNTYAHVFTSINDSLLMPGNYTIIDDGDIYVNTNVVIRLNITASSFHPTNIYVAGVSTNAGKLIVYVNGPASITLNQNVTSQGGKPSSLMFFGMPGCATITLNANGNFTGTIYAPEADLFLNGGGNDTEDFAGSIVTKTISINGHFNFHFDEDLKRTGPFR